MWNINEEKPYRSPGREKTEYEQIYGKFRKQAVEKLAEEDMAYLLDELCRWLTWVDCHLEVDRK